MTEAPTRMRVAQLVETLSAGGAETLAIDIAGALVARGHESHLIVVRGAGPMRDRIGSRVKFHDLKRPARVQSQSARLLPFLATCRSLESYLRENRIEILQAHLPMANFLGLVMSWRGVCRVYPTVHNNREFDYGERQGEVRRALRRAGYREMLARCAGMIAVSEQVKGSLLSQLGHPAGGEGRVRVVPNGVVLSEPMAEGQRRAKRAALGLSDHEILIVGAGRLTGQKNFSALLDALTRLPDTAGAWRCIIAGEGELRGALEEQARAAGLGGRVALPGVEADLAGLLGAADIFCLPSLYEGLPLVLLEAMAAGLPVVSFAFDGAADVVADGIQARLVTPGNVAAFAEAIGSLMQDEPARVRLGAHAREAVAERHGFDALIKRLETVYLS